MKPGTLFGIGVGPGDPELISIKAIRILQLVDVVFTAASTKNDYSLAVDIAGPHIPGTVVIEKLDFSMSKDRQEKEKAWHRNTGRIAEILEAGKNAAFLTLGDPLIYSTYGYILQQLQAGWPHLAVSTIPGITSFQAAAASTNRPLVEGEQSLLIMSGVHGGERLECMADKPDNVVFLKAYRNVEGICRALEAADMIDDSVAVVNCSRDNETIYDDVRVLCREKPNYWTLIIAKKKDGVTQHP
jgi:precorrin-2/cobalt-factor-2 C20-methyltransferase